MLQPEFEGGDLVQCASTGIYSEEEVKVKCVLPYLEKIGYEKENLQLDRPVKIGRGLTVYPDIVVLVDEEPAMVVETKRPGESLANYVNQVISYSRLLRAPLAILTNGFKTEVYDAFEAVSLGRDIPSLSEIQKIEKEISWTDDMMERAESTLVIFENVPKFSDVLSECHDIVWNRDHLSPEMAFDEVSKLLFLKVNEEKRGKEGKTNRLSLEKIKGYDEESLTNLIEYEIFRDTKNELPHIFTDPSERIKLRESSIKEIINKLAPFDVLGTDVDVKGLTFETFLEKTFRGDLGQYSTPREVINFMVELVEPKIGERIVDPAAGSGGFLIKIFEEL
jgi:type I restriction enzyme M protein